MTTLLYLLDILVPRFISKNWAMVRLEIQELEGAYTIYEPICEYQDLKVGEHYDATLSSSYFNFFGLALFQKTNIVDK